MIINIIFACVKVVSEKQIIVSEDFSNVIQIESFSKWKVRFQGPYKKNAMFEYNE